MNVANKQRRVAEKLRTPDHYDELSSLSLARNALAHNAGVVRSPEDCNNPARDHLEVRWLAFDMIVARDGVERIVERAPFDMQEHFPGDGPVEVGVRFTPRLIAVLAGRRLTLTHPQLAELCVFYSIVTEKTNRGLHQLFRDRGLLAD